LEKLEKERQEKGGETNINKDNIEEKKPPKAPFEIVLLTRNPKTSPDKDQFEKLVAEIKQQPNNSNPDSIVIGEIVDIKSQGEFFLTWKRLAEESGKVVDVSERIAEIVAIKDAKELKCIRSASSISSHLMKSQLVHKIEDAIDEEKKNHSRSVVRRNFEIV